MKVVVIGLRGIPGVMGGVESHCEELLPRVRAISPELEIIVVARSPYVTNGPRWYQGIYVKPLPSPSYAGVEALVSSALGTLYAKLKGGRLIHIHGIGPGLMAPLARLLGLRVVVTYHSRNYEHAKWGRIAKAILRLGESLSLSFAHRVIVVAPWLKDELARAYPSQAHKLVCITNGVSDLGLEDVETEGVDSLEPGYILAVGRIVPEKGFDYLIEAAIQSGGARKLVIVGDADHDSSYTRSVLARASGQIIFTGRQPRTALNRLYRNASLFVLPSYHEGMPIAALEAASCGTPMLLSDIPANRDLLLPEDHYFPVGDVGELAVRLSNGTELSAVDPAEIRSRFDWDRSAEATAQVYYEVIGAAEPEGPTKARPDNSFSRLR